MRQRVLAAVLVLLLCGAAAGEDVIVLTNGREIRGRILEETEDSVRIEVGGGRMLYRRDKIASVVREAVTGAAGPATATPDPAAPPESALRREEFSLLYADGARVGTRTVRASRGPEGWLFEEEVLHLDPKGVPVREVRSTERADTAFRPVSFQIRETDGKAEHRSIAGEFRGGKLSIVKSRDGIRERSELEAPEGARFGSALREEFLRSGAKEGAAVAAPIYDLKTGAWTMVRYEDRGRRLVRLDGKSFEVRVVERRRGEKADRAEREWISPDLTSAMSDLDGEFLRALGTTKAAVERLRQGDTERITGADSAARTRYADPERGFRIRKPDPSWTFELPSVRGTGAVLVVKNEVQFASVDLTLDTTARPGTTVEAAAQALQRVCRSVAQDFALAREGWIDRDGQRIYWMEATATTRGEATRTLARVIVRDGKVWRLLAACPDGAFATLRPDFESILDSFELF